MRKDIVSWEEFCFDRDITDINEIVIHGTDGVPPGGIFKWVKDGGRKEEYKKGIALFHFLVEESGECVQLLPLEKWTYHSTSGNHDKNTIGIEIEKKSNKNEPNDKQYEALTALLKYLDEQLVITTITTHDYNGTKYSPNKYKIKPCPGSITWTKIQSELPKKQYNI